MSSIVLNILGQKISKLDKKKFELIKVFMCYIFLDIFKYIFWDRYPKKIRQEKKFELCQND